MTSNPYPMTLQYIARVTIKDGQNAFCVFSVTNAKYISVFTGEIQSHEPLSFILQHANSIQVDRRIVNDEEIFTLSAYLHGAWREVFSTNKVMENLSKSFIIELLHNALSNNGGFRAEVHRLPNGVVLEDFFPG